MIVKQHLYVIFTGSFDPFHYYNLFKDKYTEVSYFNPYNKSYQGESKDLGGFGGFLEF